MTLEHIESLRQQLVQAEQDLKRELLRRTIDHTGIYRVRPGTAGLLGKAPNTRYTWQFYLRRCMFDPNFLYTAAELLEQQLPPGPRQFAACEDAGLSLAQALASRAGQSWISIKKTRKQYGLHNWTEGRVTGDPIVLVDDLAGSQATLRAARQVLTSYRLPVADYYVTLINKTQGTHRENYLANNRLISLFTCDDFAMTWAQYQARYQREPDFGPVY